MLDESITFFFSYELQFVLASEISQLSYYFLNNL